jgi:hypothetical protein
MPLVVTGIAAPNTVAAVEAALRDAGLSLDHLAIVDPAESPSPIAPHGVITASNIGPIDTGTGVPGLSSGTTIVPGASFFAGDALGDRLGDFAIPDDEAENYRDALAAGRSLIAYFADEATADRAEAAFRAAGLAKVKRF